MRDDILGRHDRLEFVHRVDDQLPGDDAPLGLRVGIPHVDAHAETVELAFGERERPVMLDRVAGRGHEERMWQLVHVAVDGDRAFVHDLEQRRLRLRTGAVDLVEQHDVREDRSGDEVEPRSSTGRTRSRRVMSDGSRSDVPWMRLNVPSIDRASARASMVLPTPGTPSTRRCCPEKSATVASATSSRLPRMTFSTLATRADMAALVCVTSMYDQYRPLPEAAS